MLIPVENVYPEYESPKKEQDSIQEIYTALQLQFYNNKKTIEKELIRNDKNR